ncbi:MAG: hypothetical protein RXO36_03455 [Candidatus Nanopusillus acidilobi]
MSWSTLVIGYFSFKKDKTYGEVKNAIKEICENLEVSVPTKIMKRSNYYRNIHHLPNGAHIVADDITNNNIDLIINDINFSSHLDSDTITIIKYIVAKYNNILSSASFGLFFLDEEGYGFGWDDSMPNDVIAEYIEDYKNLKAENNGEWKYAD